MRPLDSFRPRARRVTSTLVGAALTTGMVAAAVTADGVRHTPGADTADDPGQVWGGVGVPDDAAAAPPPVRDVPAQAGRPGSPGARLAAARLASELRPLVREPVRLTVAAWEPSTGAEVRYGSGAYETASVVKVNVVAALLLQAQDEGRELTPDERDLAAAAIRRSDNDATHELWSRIGTAEGLRAANERLGLTATSTSPDGRWGLTRTTAVDQITLLGRVFGQDSALTAASRDYLAGLMGEVVEDQSWGVSAALPGATTALKNGWLPRSTTERWHVNSVGRVAAGDTEYLVAVLSTGHVSREDGIEVVEAAARAAVDVLRTDPSPRA